MAHALVFLLSQQLIAEINCDREYGNKVIGEVTLDQAYGGARGIKALVWEVSDRRLRTAHMAS